MKVLVTGGGGFLGRYIVDLLSEEGHSVVAFQRRKHTDIARQGIDVRQGSLLDKEAIRSAIAGCDAVIHTAAKAGVWGRRDEFFSFNLVGTRNLCACMEEEAVRKMVYCSTPSVVFSGESFEGADESLPYGSNWLSDYAESKAEAEAFVLDWGRQGKGDVIALRPHLIWGPGDPHLLPKVISRSRSGRLRIIGDGTNRVDITRVENAAAAHILALQALDRENCRNRPYFISQGEPVILWDWINQLLSQVGIDPIEKKLSLPAAYRLGALSELTWRILRRFETVPPMTRFVAVELAKSHWFSIEAARRDLGYQPENFPTQAGTEAYVAAWNSGNTPR